MAPSRSGASFWSDDTEKLMRAAGWFPGRDVSHLVKKWEAELCGPDESVMFPAAERALREFGGLRVDISAPGIECAREGFHLDPNLFWSGRERLVGFEEQIGVRLFPLGEAVQGNAELSIGEDGRVFFSMVDVWLLGETIEEAIEVLLAGRKLGRKF